MALWVTAGGALVLPNTWGPVPARQGAGDRGPSRRRNQLSHSCAVCALFQPLEEELNPARLQLVQCTHRACSVCPLQQPARPGPTFKVKHRAAVPPVDCHRQADGRAVIHLIPGAHRAHLQGTRRTARAPQPSVQLRQMAASCSLQPQKAGASTASAPA